MSVVLTDRIDAPTLSCYALVALGRQPHTGWTGRLSDRDHAITRDAINAAGAADLATRQVAELSDGERQRVMIARALAQEPAVMLLDEVSAFLDLPRRIDLMRLLRDLARRERRTILLSTHDLELALRSADRIWLLERGGMLHAGAPEDLVLSGAFERAFRSEGLDFDRARGTFTLTTGRVEDVALEAEGVPRLWAIHAIERAGFGVVGATAPARRRVVATRNGVVSATSHWPVWAGGHVTDCASMGDVVSTLREG